MLLHLSYWRSSSIALRRAGLVLKPQSFSLRRISLPTICKISADGAEVSRYKRCNILTESLKNHVEIKRGFTTTVLLKNRKITSHGSEQEVDPAVVDRKSLQTHLEKIKAKRNEIKEEEIQQQFVAKKPLRENLKTIWRIIKLGKPDLKLFLLALGFILFAVLYPTAAVKLVGSSIDAINNNIKDEEGNLIIWGYKYSTVFAVMVPFMCVSAGCFWARIWVLKLLGERLVARLRLRVMKHLLRHDAKFYDQEKHKVGDLISRLSSDAYVVSRSITGNLPDGLKNALFGILSCYMMFSINPSLFGVMMLISPPITFGSVLYGEKIRALSTKLQNATAGLTKVSEETLNSVKLIQAFASEQKELTKYSNQLRNVVKVAKQEAKAQSNYLVSIYSLYHSGYLSCLALGVYLILNGQMSTGDVVSFTMYLELFNLALYSLTTTYMELMKGSGAGTKLFELIDQTDDVSPIKGKKVPKMISNDIEFKDVVFSYPTRPKDRVFNGCTFHIPGSTATCFVAPSGGGKSTIASLLLRSYNIQSGEILVGGKNIEEYQVRDIRRNIFGVVQQEPVLLSGSILENLVYGLTLTQLDQLTMDDVEDAAKQANCHDFIVSFPDGYDTIIGSRGASLSGGQKQRIAIARALIKKPSILILDEATSALDSKLESLINDTLKDLTHQGKVTIVSIAHRLSTISKSENVIVLGKNGKVIEQGKFVELYSNSESELSRLLDETSLQQLTTPKEEEDKENDQLNLDEQPQKPYDLAAVKTLIDELPAELKIQLLNQMANELQEDKEKPVSESKITSDVIS